MDIKDSYLHGTVGVVKSISVNADKLTYTLADKQGTQVKVTLPQATVTTNGVMSNSDKVKLDNLNIDYFSNIVSYKISLPDNSGRDVYILIAKLTNWVDGKGSDYGFIGRIVGYRGGNQLNTCCYNLVAMLSSYVYNNATIYGKQLYVDKHTGYLEALPYVVTYNGENYLALKKLGSSAEIYFEGAVKNVLPQSQWIVLNTPSGKSLPDNMTVLHSPNFTDAHSITTSKYFDGSSTKTLLHSGNYTNYVNTTNFPGLNKTGTVTSVTLNAGGGISIDNTAAITSTGTRTITNTGVRSISTGSTNGTISVNTNGTSANVAVKGLGSAAYTNSTGYAVRKTLTTEDLNTITTPGFYNSVGGNSCTNKPEGVDYFGMIVTHCAGGSYYVQILFEAADSTKQWRRHCLNGTWSTWTLDKLSDTTYSQATASKLGLVKLMRAALTSDITPVAAPSNYGTTRNYAVDLDKDGQMFVHVPWSNTTYSVFKGATSSAAGTSGLVPAPAANTHTYFLRGDGTWATPTNTTYNVVSNSANGLAPKVINTNTATVGTAYYVLASSDGSATPSWYKLPSNAFVNDDTKVTQTNTTTSASYRVLLSGNANDTTETTTARKSANLLFNPSTGNLTATSLNLNGDIVINDGTNHDRFIKFQYANGDNYGWRIGYLGDNHNSATNNYLTIDSYRNTAGWAPALQFKHNTMDATFGASVTATSFIGNLDGTYVNKLTGYSKATSASNIAATDTLKSALGKLEYKAHYAYDWVIGVTATDTDEYINKWGEIVGFLDSVKEGTDILDEFVTRKTDLTITGIKNFNTNYNTTTLEADTPLIISRNGRTDYECVKVSVDDATVLFLHLLDEKASNFLFKGLYFDLENNTNGANAESHSVSFNLSHSEASIKIDSNLVLHSGNYTSYKHAYTNLTGSGSTANLAIVSNGVLNGWTLKTLGSRAFDSTEYLPLTGGTLTGKLTIEEGNFGSLIVYRKGSTNSASIQFKNGSNVSLGYLGMNTANGNLFRFSADSSTSYKIWDSGIDGSGSGLDADLLDGTHKADLFTTLSNVNTTTNPRSIAVTVGGTSKYLQVAHSNNTLNLNSERFDTGAPNPTTYNGLTFQFSYNIDSDWSNVVTMRSYTDPKYCAAQIITPANNPGADTGYSGNMKWRLGRNTTWLNWRTVLDSDNYTTWINTTNFPGLNKTGTVTSIKVGSTSYSPSSGVVSLPAYPTSLKNPNAIKFKNTAGTVVSYDGSAAVDLTGGVNNAKQLDGNVETSYLRYRGQINKDYVDLTTYTSGAAGYKNYDNGVYTVTHTNALGLTTHSDILVRLAANTGSTSALEFYTSYDHSVRIKVRKNVDSNRVSGAWKELAWYSDIPTALKNPNKLTFAAGTFAAKTYDGSAAVTVNIPTHTSHLTNNSGFLTSRGYIGTTQVQASSAVLALTGISTATALYYIATTAMTLSTSTGLSTQLTVANRGGLFSNGVLFNNPTTPNDVGFIRVCGTGETDTVLEIGTGDDGASTNSEAIAARLYKAGAVAKEAWLLDTAGNTSFPGNVKAPQFTYNFVSASALPFIYVGSTNLDVTLLRVYSSDQTDSSYLGAYGYSLKYLGTGSGVGNYLNFYADNKAATAQTLALSMDNSGNVGIKTSANEAYALKVSGSANVTSVIYSDLTTSTYINGNNGLAIICSKASAGSYTMLAKMNSTNGYFTHGTYGSNYLLQYTAKTTVDAGTNSVTKQVILLDESGNSSFPGAITSTGFKKSGSSDSYVLLGGGGHKTISSLSVASANKLNSTTVVSATAFSLSNASWTDTGYTFADLATGTYAIQVTSDTNLVASGIMSVYNNLDDTIGDEIPLHVYGTTVWRPYLRTYQNKLLISSNDVNATSRTVTIKIAQIL